ncbi:unnamed protein product, partial [Sphacelaria rigidula]
MGGIGGVQLERLRADKGGEFIGKNFRTYRRQTGILLEFASTNTPQRIRLSERVGRTLAAMVRWMLADSGLPTFPWGESMLRTSYLANKALHSGLRIQCPDKMLQGRKPDRAYPQVIEAKAFVHTNGGTQILSSEPVGGRLVNRGAKNSQGGELLGRIGVITRRDM